MININFHFFKTHDNYHFHSIVVTLCNTFKFDSKNYVVFTKLNVSYNKFLVNYQ